MEFYPSLIYMFQSNSPCALPKNSSMHLDIYVRFIKPRKLIPFMRALFDRIISPFWNDGTLSNWNARIEVH